MLLLDLAEKSGKPASSAAVFQDSIIENQFDPLFILGYIEILKLLASSINRDES
jgi:hypothetical protein